MIPAIIAVLLAGGDSRYGFAVWGAFYGGFSRYTLQFSRFSVRHRLNV